MIKVRIGDKLVGPGEPVFIVAEAGVNHNGKVDLGKKLIDLAKVSRADAVKFQTFKAHKVATKYAEKADYQKRAGPSESQYDMIKKLELSDEDFTRLFNHAKQKDIIFLSSPFDEESVDLLDSLGVPAFKVASGEITNFRLLRYVARKNKPIILSTGMSAIDEIADALNAIEKEGNKQIILLHCVTSYPARMEDVNLKVIETLRNRFNLPVGFSDHTLGIAAPIAATALGAVLIEKHFTLDKHLPGPDHKASLDPDELKNMIRTIRDVEKSLGDGTRKLTEDEDKIKQIARRSIVARVEIPKGSLITEDMLDFKRPGIGIAPKYVEKMLGKEAKHRIKKDELIDWDALK